MSLARKTIRNYIVDLIRRKETIAKDNVFGNRSQAVWQENLPTILVYSRSEEITERSVSPRELKRDMRLVIEVVVASDSDDESSDKLDDLMDDIERILSPDDSLNGKVDSIVLDSVEFDFDEEAQQPIASGRLIYKVIYYQFSPEDRRDQEEVALTGLIANWDVGTAKDPDFEATDNIDLPQT